MDEKLELYRQKYKKNTFIKTIFGYNQRCIILVEEIRLDRFGCVAAKGLGVNAANEFVYAEFGLSGNGIRYATQSDIEFWKKQRVKAFFSETTKIQTSVK